MTNPTVPDGPDTELDETTAWFRKRDRYGTDPEDWIADGGDGQRHAAAIVRAVLARPAATVSSARHSRDAAHSIICADLHYAGMVDPVAHDLATHIVTSLIEVPPLLSGDVQTIVDARPAAGRDLTADDVRLALVGMGYYLPVGDAHYAVANYLNGIACPARPTDGGA